MGPEALAGSTGLYYATIRIKAGMVPVNLVHEIADVGFDYGMTERAVAEAVVARHFVVRERAVELSAGGREAELPPARPAGPASDAAAEGGGEWATDPDTAHARSRLSDEHVPLQLDDYAPGTITRIHAHDGKTRSCRRKAVSVTTFGE